MTSLELKYNKIIDRCWKNKEKRQVSTKKNFLMSFMEDLRAWKGF